jgi:hypothetical protein
MKHWHSVAADVRRRTLASPWPIRLLTSAAAKIGKESRWDGCA